jgi:hypothetical protein
MIKLEYDKGGCVGCPPEMGCLGKSCPECWEAHITCDVCKQEVEVVSRIEDVDYCDSCLYRVFPRIDYDNCADYIEEAAPW